MGKKLAAQQASLPKQSAIRRLVLTVKLVIFIIIVII